MTINAEARIAQILGPGIAFVYKDKSRGGGESRHVIILKDVLDSASDRPVVVAGETPEAAAIKAATKLPGTISI